MITFQSVFPPYRGGISRFSDYLLRELSEATDVEAWNYRALYPPLLFPGKTQYSTDPAVGPDASRLVHAWNPLNWKSAARKMVASNPDAYLYSHWHPFTGISQIRLLRHLRRMQPDIRTAGIFHNILPHESFPFQQSILKELLHLTDLPVVLSGQTATELTSILPGKEHLRLFHPVYSRSWPSEPRMQVRHEHGISEKETVLLFFGLVRDYKGLDILIEATNQIDLQALGLRVLVAGEFYTDKTPLLDKISRNNRDSFIIMDRFLTDQEAARILYLSDIMVLPYRSASQSGVLMDAFNYGLPSIVSDLPGLTEHIENGKTGFIVPPEDIGALTDCIRNIPAMNPWQIMQSDVLKKRDALSWKTFASNLMESFGRN